MSSQLTDWQTKLWRDISSHERFSEDQEWIGDNGAIVTELVHRARETKTAGFDSYSIRALWEVARYELTVTRRSGDKFALNNNLVPLVARTVLLLAPDLGPSFFEFRSIRVSPDAVLSMEAHHDA